MARRPHVPKLGEYLIEEIAKWVALNEHTEVAARRMREQANPSE
jgi:hypothetical protein